LILNGIFLVVELIVGLITGSLALLSDAAHMVSDVAALALALGAAHLSLRAADAIRTYGWRRAETLGAFVNGIALVLACGIILKESVERLIGESPDVAALPVLIAGAIGLAINLGSAYFLARSDTDNLNVRGALLHMLADALGSVGAMLAAVGLHYGYPVADPLVGLLIGLMVLWGSVGLLRQAGGVLLQFTPDGLDVAEVERELCRLPGVGAVHDLHLWSLDGQQNILTAHLVLEEPDQDPYEVQAAAHDLLLRRYGVDHCTVQIEWGDGCGGCSLHPPGHGSTAPPHPKEPNEAHDHGHDHA